MKINKLAIASSMSILLSLMACGGSSKAENQRDLERFENRNLQAENEKLKRQFRNTYATKKNVWVFRGAFADYIYAEKICKDVGFELPTLAEIEEYRLINPEKFDDLKTLKVNGSPMVFHVKDKTKSVKSGIALCTKKNK